jgi:predicted DNA-binding transcriptional regulator AlpA
VIIGIGTESPIQYNKEIPDMEHFTSKITLPETGFLRLSSIIGDRKSDPPIPALIPVSRSTWLAGVKSGRFPKSIKLGPRITVWRVEDIRSLIHESQVSG